MMDAKRDLDIKKGRQRRGSYINQYNAYFVENGYPLAASFLHDTISFKVMKGGERAKHNLVKNYAGPVPEDEAMALHAKIMHKTSLKVIRVIFMIKEKGRYYLKLPKEYKNDPEGFLKYLQAFSYHIIITETPEGKVFSRPLPIKEILPLLSYTMGSTKNNANRMDFHPKLGSTKNPLTTATCFPFKQKTLEGSHGDLILNLSK